MMSEPFWRSNHVHGESLFFVRTGADEAPKARLLFKPAGPVAIAAASGETVYREGRDYVVDAASGTVVLTAISAIPFTDAGELYRNLGAEHTIPHRTGDPATGLYWCEGRFFHDLQVEASYDHRSTWRGYRPAWQGDRLPATVRRLGSEGLAICVLGDSISAGANASGRTGAPPHRPPYPDLLAAALERRFGVPVALTNLAVGGKRVAHGLEVVEAAVAAQPDLVVIAYGMNDAGSTPVDAYAATVAAIIDRTRAALPQTEFILVASMLGNPHWQHTPTGPFFAFRDALRSLCADRVVLADMTQLWADMLAVKSYHDLTGNGVNHPNDFGHGLYAQVLLDLIAEPHGQPTSVAS